MTIEELQAKWPNVCIACDDQGGMWYDGRYVLTATVNGEVVVRAHKVNGDHRWFNVGAAHNGLDRELEYVRGLLNGEG